MSHNVTLLESIYPVGKAGKPVKSNRRVQRMYHRLEHERGELKTAGRRSYLPYYRELHVLVYLDTEAERYKNPSNG
jgi:hypothetical protein